MYQPVEGNAMRSLSRRISASLLTKTYARTLIVPSAAMVC